MVVSVHVCIVSMTTTCLAQGRELYPCIFPSLCLRFVIFLSVALLHWAQWEDEVVENHPTHSFQMRDVAA